MITIIQDFQNLYNAYIDVMQKRKDLCDFQESIIERCDRSLMFENLYKSELYLTGLRNAMACDDFKRYHQLEEENSVKCRASSCFFRLKDGEIIKYRPHSTIKPNRIFSCVNTKYISCVPQEVRCDGCGHYKEIIEYKDREKQFQQAKQAKETAKQKLLSDLVFWKQK